MELSVDAWALKRITLDTADGSIPDVLIAHEGDANGRGIALSVVQGGVPADMAGMAVYLAWGHEGGSQGLTEFAAVDAAAGKWKVYYPEAMQRKGTVIARIMVYVGERTPITGSRDFRVFVEGNPIDEDAAVTTDDFSVFKRAVEDLAIARSEFEDAYTEQMEAHQKSYDASENARDGLYSAAEAVRESKFMTKETARQTNEDGRISAEVKRKADFAEIVDAAQGLKTQILAAGQYDQGGKPTVQGTPGVIYLVPVEGPSKDDMNSYVEWMYLSGAWEVIGGTQTTVTAITTSEIDSVSAGEAPTGTSMLSLSGLSYLWAKLKAAFASKSHKHGDADITAVSGSKLSDASVSRAKLDAGLEADIAGLEDAWDSVSQAKIKSTWITFGAVPAASTVTVNVDIANLHYQSDPQVWFQSYGGAACVSVTSVQADSVTLRAYNPSASSATISGWVKTCPY